MAGGTVQILHRLAALLFSIGAFSVAVLALISMIRRRGRRPEPLAVVFCVLFIAMAIHTAIGVVANDVRTVPAAAVLPLLVVDWIAALGIIAFLALRSRYEIFMESAEIVHEYETEYAEKEREARSLAQINEELRRLDEQKSEFLAMVSHELRTPLTAIIGYSRLLVQQVHGPLSPKQLEHQEAIFRSAQRLTDVINDLLDVSRLESGHVELAPRPTDVRQITDQVIAVVTVAAQAKQIRTTNALPADLPAVQADATRLQQILMNLLGNAVKFTPNGGAVRVEGGRHKDQVWVAVEDSGAGIAKEELARIWDPFYQVEAPMRRRHGGTGLGLTIVRRLVELHGGLVRAESGGENQGSRFTFTLPAAPQGTQADAIAEPEVRVEPVLAGRPVLIVEDEAQNRALMRVVVEDLLGGQAWIEADGERALFEAMENPPALILLDLMLPGLSGWEVARRLRQSPRTRAVPIIAVSALARMQEREAALHAGCDAYLAKPFTPDEMARVVAGIFVRRGVTLP